MTAAQFLQTIVQIKGLEEISDAPDKLILDSLAKGGRNLKLRFEHLGMLPFAIISPHRSSWTKAIATAKMSLHDVNHS